MPTTHTQHHDPLAGETVELIAVRQQPRGYRPEWDAKVRFEGIERQICISADEDIKFEKMGFQPLPLGQKHRHNEWQFINPRRVVLGMVGNALRIVGAYRPGETVPVRFDEAPARRRKPTTYQQWAYAPPDERPSARQMAIWIDIHIQRRQITTFPEAPSEKLPKFRSNRPIRKLWIPPFRGFHPADKALRRTARR